MTQQIERAEFIEQKIKHTQIRIECNSSGVFVVVVLGLVLFLGVFCKWFCLFCYFLFALVFFNAELYIGQAE